MLGEAFILRVPDKCNIILSDNIATRKPIHEKIMSSM